MRVPPGEVHADEECDVAEKHGEEGWDSILGLTPPAAASDCSALCMAQKRKKHSRCGEVGVWVRVAVAPEAKKSGIIGVLSTGKGYRCGLPTSNHETSERHPCSWAYAILRSTIPETHEASLS